MKFQHLFKSSFGYRTAGLLTVCALIGSFGLHSIQIQHGHPGHHTDEQGGEHGEAVSEITEYAHATEKKSLLILSASLLVLVPSLLLSVRWNEFVTYSISAVMVRLKRFRILNLAFYSDEYQLLMAGKLNPKTY